MSLEYDDCLKRGKIKPFSRGKELARKELDDRGIRLEEGAKNLRRKRL